MPTDLHLNSDRDVHLDDANDLALVSGVSNLEQSVAIAAGNAIEQFVGSRVQGTSVALLEERLRSALDSDPQVQSVERVEVVEFDRRTNTVTFDVMVTDDDDFTLSVSS